MLHPLLRQDDGVYAEHDLRDGEARLQEFVKLVPGPAGRRDEGLDLCPAPAGDGEVQDAAVAVRREAFKDAVGEPFRDDHVRSVQVFERIEVEGDVARLGDSDIVVFCHFCLGLRTVPRPCLTSWSGFGRPAARLCRTALRGSVELEANRALPRPQPTPPGVPEGGRDRGFRNVVAGGGGGRPFSPPRVSGAGLDDSCIRLFAVRSILL